MSKYEFLSILGRELGNLDAETRNEILNDFGEHFDIGLRSGKSEEEISRVLGDPRDIAQEFSQNRREQAADTERRTDEDRYAAYTPNRREDTADISDEDTAFSFDGFVKNVDARRVRCVRLDLTEDDIEIRGGNQSRITLQTDEDDEDAYSVSLLPDGVFYIKKQRGHGGSDISLELPEDYYGDLEVTTRSGDIQAANLSSLASFKARSSSGDMEAENVRCAGEFRVHITGSGDASLSAVAAERFVLASASGDFDISRLNASSTLNMSTGSGDIDLRECKCPGGFNVSTGSGDIGSDNGAGQFKASTGSGEVVVTNHLGTVWASTGSGNIEIETDEITSDVTYSTGSGDINIECRRLSGNIRIASGSGDIEFSAYELGGNITGRTVSGDIDLSLGRGSNAVFALKTGFSGRKRNEFDRIRSEQYQNTACKVSLETLSGDIDIKAL
ncbi:MAG: DUF4097 family beta strand repeat-containing protein [Clostridiales bacterium]|jgi:DUF4097 and DUF4098 domain-containing protein YvlB|nr:DUF4097 family beta strand repeat-containing protein [Clostridiales bacterium]